MGGETFQPVLVREDAQNDLAIIKVEKKTASLAFRDESRVRAGDPVTVIGFPLSNILSKEPHVSTGSITALAGIKDDIRFLQVSAPVQPGNSGGPVLDEAVLRSVPAAGRARTRHRAAPERPSGQSPVASDRRRGST
jgi:S1-C subfamily serine protease